jgi:DNA-binding NtrC family response regulator
MKPKILFIDDEKTLKKFRESLQAHEMEKWDIYFAIDPKEAFSILFNGGIDVAICGTHIEGINSNKLYNEIVERFRNVNIILNDSNSEKCVSRKDYVQSDAFDMYCETEQSLEPSTGLYEKIEIAVAAKRMKDTGRF